MTTLTFHLARGLGRAWGPGDEVVVTELDHRANVDPWLALAKDRGVTIRMVRADAGSGELDWADFERQVGPRTRLVAVGAASNALGTISDVKRAAALAHAHGALCFVDAVHYAPHALVDVAALDCDFLACSAYKFYGPHVGILWGRRTLLEGVDVPKLMPAPDDAPDRLETGTGNFEGIMGAAAAVDFLAGLGEGAARRERLASAFARLHEAGSVLVRRLWEGLGEIPGVTRYGPPPDRPRTPTVSFALDGVASVDVARRLAGHALFVSNGDFYASTIVGRLGHAEDGLVRVGCACYTTPDEVERLLEGVRSLGSRRA
jgi:cysteine desulfurase family protein (TIGR01976 family)